MTNYKVIVSSAFTVFVVVSMAHAAIVSHFSYDGERASSPCKSVVGSQGVVCDAKFQPVDGNGSLKCEDGVVWIPRRSSLRIEHGLAVTTNNPSWCMALKVRTAANAPWHCFYTTKPGEDGALFLKDHQTMGSRRWGGYSNVAWTNEVWNTVVVSYSAADAAKSVFLNGKYLRSSGELSAERLGNRPYFYISGDEDGEDGNLGVGEIRIWNEAFPKELFSNGAPSEVKAALKKIAQDAPPPLVPVAEIRKLWDANKADPHSTRFEFDDNGVFTFLHITDIQEAKKLHTRSASVLREAIKRFHPQLAVLTGDNVETSCGGGDNFVWTIEPFVSIFREFELPFCLTFGNHDTGNGVNRQWQYEQYILAGGKYFVDHDVPELRGGGNGFVDICRKGAKEPSFRLYVMDSGAYAPGGYDGCHTDQIQWFEKVVGNIPFLWFQHIVVPDINKTGLLVGGKLAEGVTGVSKEPPCPPPWNVYTNADHTYEGRTLYQSWQKSGCHRGSYFGHDHKNTYDGVDKNGIRLGYTKALTLCSYNDNNPGLRVFKVKPGGTFETFIFTENDMTPQE